MKTKTLISILTLTFAAGSLALPATASAGQYGHKPLGHENSRHHKKYRHGHEHDHHKRGGHDERWYPYYRMHHHEHYYYEHPVRYLYVEPYRVIEFSIGW
jgi:Ni/Co efflux regulator RcnB